MKLPGVRPAHAWDIRKSFPLETFIEMIQADAFAAGRCAGMTEAATIAGKGGCTDAGCDCGAKMNKWHSDRCPCGAEQNILAERDAQPKDGK